MASITIRNLEDDTKHRMKLRAAQHGRSMEEEARDILRRATAREDAPSYGSARAAIQTPPLNLSDEVMTASMELGINISQVCEQHLREVVRRTRERKWREEHAGFIAAYNATVEAEGLPLDEWRSF